MMAKGRGHNRKKDARRARADRRATERRAGLQTAATGAQPPGTTEATGTATGMATGTATGMATGATAAPQRGLAALRGQVSNAYRVWAADYGRRQTQAMAGQFPEPSGEAGAGGAASSDVFVLAPLVTRTVDTPDEQLVSVQMGLPIVSTRGGNVSVAPDRLAVAALRMPPPDTGSAMAALGLGQAPDLPLAEPLFAIQLPAERMSGARLADALAWYIARAVEAGDVPAEPRAMTEAAGEALALLRPNLAPYGVKPIDRSLLDAYDGYGADADEEVVPLDIQAAPARGGVAGLPSGAYLQDNGAPLAALFDDLRDYVIGLWPYEYFNLEGLTAGGAGDAEAGGPARAATLERLANLVRRLDEALAESAENEEAMLASEGRPPAWIAQETARYREARQELRATRVAQELLPRLGPILFDLEIPPSDYAPAGVAAGADEGALVEEDEE